MEQASGSDLAKRFRFEVFHERVVKVSVRPQSTKKTGTSLLVQWLRLLSATAGGTG